MVSRLISLCIIPQTSPSRKQADTPSGSGAGSRSDQKRSTSLKGHFNQTPSKNDTPCSASPPPPQCPKKSTRPCFQSIQLAWLVALPGMIQPGYVRTPFAEKQLEATSEAWRRADPATRAKYQEIGRKSRAPNMSIFAGFLYIYILI